MASKRSASMTLLLALIILLFSLVSACPFCHSSGSNLASSPSAQGSCPIDILKLDVCANLLDLVNVTVGSPQATPCCSHLGGLNETEAATCLCTALRANVLGINLNIPIALSLLLNVCSFNVPSGFQCAN